MLLAGGLLAWLHGVWPGIAIHQAGYGWLLSSCGAAAGCSQPAIPWPLVGLTLALGALAIPTYLAGLSRPGTALTARRRPAGPAGRLARLARWLEPAYHWTGIAWLVQRIEPWWAKAHSYIASHLPKAPRPIAAERMLAVLACRAVSWLHWQACPLPWELSAVGASMAASSARDRLCCCSSAYCPTACWLPDCGLPFAPCFGGATFFRRREIKKGREFLSASLGGHAFVIVLAFGWCGAGSAPSRLSRCGPEPVPDFGAHGRTLARLGVNWGLSAF